jgi:phage shock protein A
MTMGIFSRIKRAAKAKANAMVDKASDPEKELDMAITELDEIRKKALDELVSYKAAAKKMEQDIAREEGRAAEWERRAMAAVKAGDDELARQALREQKQSREEIARIRRDRDEAASHAIQLNRSRKEAETKLRMLKLRKGTLATQLKAARSGGGVLGVDGALFDKFDDAEMRIDQDAIEAEVAAAMEGEEMGGGGGMSEAEFDRKLAAAGADPAGIAGGADDPLAALKAKMEADQARKKLPE